ncbi:ubiquitin-protein ligase E3C isoform X1 [Harpegnathos saltator]|uniref:Ubiquitin-protein ligase E3C n=1 Tax=Harpegnathos saltator TaxID=610380 RepID=E2C2T7_HARSA|nr:ubiquitin-protein ligase E3C isoform X1 [Harpegnathos saltator]XP_011149634.1 ubiquitin-protein ligase E3C isoform X1 [Harpegnathos saltator]EFN77772.1 Ubiquitin-protein ligase E3C [Harpegnathos saltator]
MYSFEGDYRRKPQQNLSGASRRDEKAVLLQHAQLERLKREQQRKKHVAALKIQAYVRSFIIRKLVCAQKRREFDEAQQVTGRRNLTLEELVPYLRKLLFFYNHALDANRLIWILQHFLKHQKEIKLKSVNSLQWLWRLRWILRISMQYNIQALPDGAYSMAIPLRVLEVFTTREDTERILRENSYRHLESIFVYLIKHNYFEQLRKLLDEKVPPMLEVSSVAPTPISKCLLDMIKRPLDLISYLDRNENFAILMLQELCRSIFCPGLSDPIRMFVIPALAEYKDFPYVQLISCINRSNLVATINLLYCVLSLESNQISSCKSEDALRNYLQVLASLTSTIMPLIAEQTMKQADDSDNDESNTNVSDQQQTNVTRSLEMLNEQQRVSGILSAVDRFWDPAALLQPLCELCHHLLIIDKLAVHKYKLLYTLAFKPMFLKHLWTTLLSVCQISLFGGATPLLQIISRGIALSAEDTDRIVPLLAVFCSLFSLLIATLHDTEFFVEHSSAEETSDSGRQQQHQQQQQAIPFTTSELVVLSSHLKGVCLGLVELAFPDTRPTVRDDYKNAVLGPASTVQSRHDTQIWTHLFKVTVGLLRQLHTRDLRRQFCPDGHWIASNVMIPIDKPEDFAFRRRRLRGYVPFQSLRAFTREELEEGPPLSAKEVRTLTLLREIPFVVPFNNRVVVFQSLIYKDKAEQQGEVPHFMLPAIQISVRRNYLYEDAFEKLSPENEPELRMKMRVQLVNTAGLEEAGVDGGGLFREFLSELLKTCFDPNRGFFKLTKDNMLYPNPTVQLLFDDFPKHYYFIGRILGKALYENLLVELPFAEFFLSKIVGRQSDVDVHHLASLDPIMYRNLLYLKSYKGDVADLGLDFTVLSDELGERRVDELKPSGANIPVTNHNRIEYIHLMADYKLNKQIRAQCYAFKQGIGSVVPLDWLQMFNNKELQVLISGAQIPVDVNDLMLHTNYTGGYASDHPTITAFWKIVNEFNDQQKGQLLKFVTSCSRPPLLGFKELDPPFCIQHAGIVDRLPTSSTCMNLLKLPEFPDEKTLREKLLYAIQAGAGFELS